MRCRMILRVVTKTWCPLAFHRKFSWESSSFKPWLSMLNAQKGHIFPFSGRKNPWVIYKELCLGHLPLSYCLIRTPKSALPVFNCLPNNNSPLWKQEENWSWNVSCSGFRDHYCGCAGQLLASFFFLSLVTVPEFFAACKESCVWWPRASGFCNRASESCS